MQGIATRAAPTIAVDDQRSDAQRTADAAAFNTTPWNPPQPLAAAEQGLPAHHAALWAALTPPAGDPAPQTGLPSLDRTLGVLWQTRTGRFLVNWAARSGVAVRLLDPATFEATWGPRTTGPVATGGDTVDCSGDFLAGSDAAMGALILARGLTDAYDRRNALSSRSDDAAIAQRRALGIAMPKRDPRDTTGDAARDATFDDTVMRYAHESFVTARVAHDLHVVDPTDAMGRDGSLRTFAQTYRASADNATVRGVAQRGARPERDLRRLPAGHESAWRTTAADDGVLPRTNDPRITAALRRLATTATGRFLVSFAARHHTKVVFGDTGTPNAMAIATGNSVIVQSPDFVRDVDYFAVLLAHELTHIYDFRTGLISDSRRARELRAKLGIPDAAMDADPSGMAGSNFTESHAPFAAARVARDLGVYDPTDALTPVNGLRSWGDTLAHRTAANPG